MTTTTGTPTQTHTPILDEVRRRSGWAVFMGVLTAALGIVLMVYPFATATATTLFLGWMLALAGAAEMALALYSQSAGTFFLRLLVGALYGFTGVLIIVNPFAGIESLTLVVGVLLLLRGILVMVAAFRVKPMDGWGWFVADSIATLVAGGLIVAQWPSSTSWAVGTLVGASVLVTGIARTIFAARIRQGTGQVRQMARGTT